MASASRLAKILAGVGIPAPMNEIIVEVVFSGQVCLSLSLSLISSFHAPCSRGNREEDRVFSTLLGFSAAHLPQLAVRLVQEPIRTASCVLVLGESCQRYISLNLGCAAPPDHGFSSTVTTATSFLPMILLLSARLIARAGNIRLQ